MLITSTNRLLVYFNPKIFEKHMQIDDKIIGKIHPINTKNLFFWSRSRFITTKIFLLKNGCLLKAIFYIKKKIIRHYKNYSLFVKIQILSKWGKIVYSPFLDINLKTDWNKFTLNKAWLLILNQYFTIKMTVNWSEIKNYK